MNDRTLLTVVGIIASAILCLLGVGVVGQSLATTNNEVRLACIEQGHTPRSCGVTR